jgi:hypothetical protein
MPKVRQPFPVEDAPNFDPENPYADKVALTDHRHYKLGLYFVTEAKAKARTPTNSIGRELPRWPLMCLCIECFQT